MINDFRVPTSARCSCPLHDQGFLSPPTPAADVTCPMCRRPFCKHCFRLCGHECDWGGGELIVEPVRTERPAGVPA